MDIPANNVSDVIEGLKFVTEHAHQADSLIRDLKEFQEGFVLQYQTRQKVHASFQLASRDQNTTPAHMERLIHERDTLEASLRQKASQLTTLRLNFLHRLSDNAKHLYNIVRRLVDEELEQWKRRQQLSGNGGDFVVNNLDDIQRWCGQATELTWATRQQLKQMEQLCFILPMDSPLGDIATLGRNVTMLLEKLVTKTFVIEKQPPQVMKTNTRFGSTLRFLTGDKLNVHLSPPPVRVVIISENQADNFTKSIYQYQSYQQLALSSIATNIPSYLPPTPPPQTCQQLSAAAAAAAYAYQNFQGQSDGLMSGGGNQQFGYSTNNSNVGQYSTQCHTQNHVQQQNLHMKAQNQGQNHQGQQRAAAQSIAASVAAAAAVAAVGLTANLAAVASNDQAGQSQFQQHQQFQNQAHSSMQHQFQGHSHVVQQHVQQQQHQQQHHHHQQQQPNHHHHHHHQNQNQRNLQNVVGGNFNFSTIEASGEILNSIGTMDYHQASRQLSCQFRNMQLKKIKRAEKKGTESVMDEKFTLLFYSTLRIVDPSDEQSGARSTWSGGDLVFDIWTMSLPVVVIVHGNQEPHAWATTTWDNAFAMPQRSPFVVPERVYWTQLGEVLSLKFESTVGRRLSDDNLKFLATKALRITPEQLAMHDYKSHTISWAQFAKDPLPDRNFTFWEWFYAILKVTREHLRQIWCDGHMIGFASRKETEDMLLNPQFHMKTNAQVTGTFLLRYSESELGGVTIAWVSPTTSTSAITHSSYNSHLHPESPGVSSGGTLNDHHNHQTSNIVSSHMAYNNNNISPTRGDSQSPIDHRSSSGGSSDSGTVTPMDESVMMTSDSACGNNSIGSNSTVTVTNVSSVLMLQPFTSRDFAIRSLADRVRDLQNLLYLYPETPKDQAFGPYYTPLSDNHADIKGYVKPVLVIQIPSELTSSASLSHHGSISHCSIGNSNVVNVNSSGVNGTHSPGQFSPMSSSSAAAAAAAAAAAIARIGNSDFSLADFDGQNQSQIQNMNQHQHMYQQHNQHHQQMLQQQQQMHHQNNIVHQHNNNSECSTPNPFTPGSPQQQQANSDNNQQHQSFLQHHQQHNVIENGSSSSSSSSSSSVQQQFHHHPHAQDNDDGTNLSMSAHEHIVAAAHHAVDSQVHKFRRFSDCVNNISYNSYKNTTKTQFKPHSNSVSSVLECNNNSNNSNNNNNNNNAMSPNSCDELIQNNQQISSSHLISGHQQLSNATGQQSLSYEFQEIDESNPQQQIGINNHQHHNSNSIDEISQVIDSTTDNNSTSYSTNNNNNNNHHHHQLYNNNNQTQHYINKSNNTIYMNENNNNNEFVVPSQFCSTNNYGIMCETSPSTSSSSSIINHPQMI